MTSPRIFADFNLSETTLASLSEMGLQNPTPIQEKALPILLDGESDFIGLASTGTGKTAAFGIPLIEKTDVTKKTVQALILSPTRELAMQVSEQLAKIGRQGKISVTTVYGGTSYRTQKDSLRRGTHFIVATPGRLVDLIKQGAIDLKHIHTLVLDEADEMMSMGFQEELDFILKATHPEDDAEASQRAACTTWLFSATMSKDVRRVADKYLTSPKSVEINKSQGVSETIEQQYYAIRDSHKTEVIARILEMQQDFYGIIFCQTKLEVIELEEILTKRGFLVDSLHGDKQQKEREITLGRFKSGKTRVLVATDVAARGLDVNELTHVINHSLPWDVESYIHRIGRTGRNGKKGIAISLISPDQIRLFHRIQTVTKIQLKKGELPSAEQVALFKIARLVQRFAEVDTESRQYKWASELLADFEENSTPGDNASTEVSDLWARMLVTHYPEILTDYDPVKELSMDRRDGPSSGGRFGGRGGGRSNDRGGDRGPRSGGGRFGGRGGDRGDRAPRSEDRGFRDDRGPREDRPAFRGSERGGDRGFDRGGERSERGGERRFDRGPRTEDRAPRYDRPTGERSERPARSADRSERAPRSEDRGPRAERPERDRSERDRSERPRFRPSGGSRK